MLKSVFRPSGEIVSSDGYKSEDQRLVGGRGRIELVKKTHMYGPGRPFRAVNSNAVSSVRTGPPT